MDCRKVYQKLVRHDFGRRPEEKIEEHLSDCPNCRTAHEEFAALDQTLKEAMRFEHHPEFWDDFHYGLKLRLEEEKCQKPLPSLKKTSKK